MSKPTSTRQVIAQNRKARHDYTILESFEAGLVLTGSEVKSLRLGRCSIKESYATAENGDIVLVNANILEYPNSGRFNHAPMRPRKLLLHKREIRKLLGAINKKGLTLVPLILYFNQAGLVKLELGLGQGKKKHDKREDQKERDWQRQKERLMRNK